MEANKTPEKIYLTKLMLFAAPTISSSDNDIEYIRTNVFIERTVEFLKIYKYKRNIIDERTIEDFRNYIKG